MPSIPSLPLGTHPWQLVETGHDPARAALHETLFAVGNGHLGLRGGHEEGALWPGAEGGSGVLVNGFFDSEDIRYPENAYGLARRNEFIVPVPDGRTLHWQVNGEPFSATHGTLEDYRRCFDLREGTLTRRFVWRSPAGDRVRVDSCRIACLARPAVYAVSFKLPALDGPARVGLDSTLEARSTPAPSAGDDPRTGTAHAAQALVRLNCVHEGEQVTLVHRTRHSGLVLASTLLHRLHDGALQDSESGNAERPGHRYTVALRAGESVTLVKFCAVVSTRDADEAELTERATQQVQQAADAGFEALLAEQREALQAWWRDADIELEGDAPLQQGLRFALLHLLQSTGRDGRTSIAAKGLTGTGYDGHYFWDGEIYVLPVLLHTQPALARRLLEFRCHTLDAARQRARELNHPQGALFPWRTISGPECSAYFPAGTAQVHINADIAYAFKCYWEATGDDAFMAEHGAELVFETARIWLTHGHHGQRDGRPAFLIHTVTGPDEYTALVDNNFYTNVMAQMHLRFAAAVAQWLQLTHPADMARVARHIDLQPGEPASWQHAADAMLVPYDAQRGIHPQDDSFLSKPRWDAARIPPEQHPLLLHYHSLVIYRHQVCKQADVLLALMLLGDRFTADDKRRDFDYYEPITTHDSSLSKCVFGIVAAEVGHADKALAYFIDGARTDLDDRHGNTRHGVHAAAMGGAWLGIVAGFAGLRMRDGTPTLAPQLPAPWQRYAFGLRVRGARLRVSVAREGCTYELTEGPELAFEHHGTATVLTAARPHLHFPSEQRQPQEAGA